VSPRLDSPDEVLVACRSLARPSARVLDAGAAVELLSDDQAWLVQAAVDHVDRAQVATCAMMLGDEPRSVRDPVFVVARARAVVLVARPDEPTLAGVAAVQTLSCTRASGAVHRLEQVAAVSAALAVSSDLTSTLTTITEAFVPAVAEGVRVELSAEFDHRTHATGVATDERKRTLELTAHGESLGQLRLFGVRASTDDADDTLFVEELARRASLAVHAARTFRDLRAAIDAREEFLSVAGHELRTPLTTLKMCLFGMRDTSPSEARVAERQIARLETVVDQLLDITKMSAGRLNLEPEQVDLAALVREVAGQLDHAQQSSGSEIAIRVQGSPAGMWDRFRIAQVITNLLTNALKYGGGWPVDVEIDDDADVVRLSVRDRGIGIAHDALQRIFDRFERAVTSREYAGFGVGLWICRQIVEAHGGVIRVESKPAEGSEFLVVLPKRLQSEVA